MARDIRLEKLAKERGFSLVEVAVSLLIVGLLAAILATPWLRRGRDRSAAASSAGLERAETALLGFAVAHNRLPCPDADGDGKEDCSVSSGLLPYRSMGMAAPFLNRAGRPLAYSVYRRASATPALDADLAVAKNRFEPYLPNGLTAGNNNGADLCLALRNAALQPASAARTHVGPDSDPINQAFALADPGVADADGDGVLLDGLNDGGNGFAPPDQPGAAGYDDRTAAAGFGGLAADLGCPALMARVNSAARSAFAAYDISTLQDYYYQFRDFDRGVSQYKMTMATFKLVMVGVNDVINVARLVTSIALSAVSGGANTAVAAVRIALTAVKLTALSAAAVGREAAAANSMAKSMALCDLAGEARDRAVTAADAAVAAALEADREAVLR